MKFTNCRTHNAKRLFFFLIWSTTRSRRRGKIYVERSIRILQENATQACVLISLRFAQFCKHSHCCAAIEINLSNTIGDMLSGYCQYEPMKSYAMTVYLVKSFVERNRCVSHWHNSFVGQQIRPIESGVKGHFDHFTHLFFIQSFCPLSLSNLRIYPIKKTDRTV